MEPRLPPARRSGPPWFWTVAAFLAVLASAGAWLALVAAPAQRDRLVGYWRDQLSAIADDRKAALDRWVFERFGDVGLLAANEDVAALVAGSSASTGLSGKRAALTSRVVALLDLVMLDYSYRGALLLDSNGRALVTRGEGLGRPSTCLDLARRAAAAGPVADSALSATGKPVLQFAAPIRVGGDPRPRGVVVLAVDPTEWLYPFLGRQAVMSTTAETMLVRRDGDSALFLTPVRHRPRR